MTVRAAFWFTLVLLAACAAPPLVPPAAPTVQSAVPPPPRSGASSEEETAAVPIRANNATWGSRTALVTIVEFSDFQCPYCQSAQPTLARLRSTYGPDTLRVVWKNNPLPFHDGARTAAEAAAGVLALAGVDAFWRFHDLVFSDPSKVSDAVCEAWARQAGVVDVTAFRAGLANHAWADVVDADMSDGRMLGVDGTPMFFVNGVSVAGAKGFDAFRAVVDDQVRAARVKLSSGTAPERVYTELAHDNRALPPSAPDANTDADDSTTLFKIPVGTSPVLGAPTALVTIVEFSDFQCPFCGRVESTLRAIRDKYGDQVRLVWKNEPLPFHPWAEPAAQAALEVRAEKGFAAFWRVHDAILANQRDLSDEVLVALASAAGARAADVKKAMASHAHAADIDADLDLAEDFEAKGTPHFFLNGRRVVGAQPLEAFEKVIDEEIVRAKELVQAGTKPSELYDALTKDGKGPTPPDTRMVLPSLPHGDPTRGRAGAKVTIHEWSDFQCPYCARVEPALTQLLKTYGDRVLFVWHDLPLAVHPAAAMAAEAAREAFKQKGERAFWALHDKMLESQQKLTREDLDGYATDLGLDMDRWKASLDAASHADEIGADAKAAEDMAIHGTPGFLIVASGGKAGYFLRGAQPYAKFRKLVDRALAEAK